MKRLASLLLASLTVIAVAQSPTLEATRGRGVAVAEGKAGQFRFEVARTTLGERSRLVGGFSYHQPGRPDQGIRPVDIRMEQPASLRVDGNRAGFAGRAVMVVPAPNNQVRRIPGQLQVMVQDNRKPNDPNAGTEVDTLAFKFENREARVSFDFVGRVREGDILVVTRAPQP